MKQPQILSRADLLARITPTADALGAESRVVWKLLGAWTVAIASYWFVIRPLLPAEDRGTPLATLGFFLLVSGLFLAVELSHRIGARRPKWRATEQGLVRRGWMGETWTRWRDIDHAEVHGDRWPCAFIVMGRSGRRVVYLPTAHAWQRDVAAQLIERVPVVRFEREVQSNVRRAWSPSEGHLAD